MKEKEKGSLKITRFPKRIAVSRQPHDTLFHCLFESVVHVNGLRAPNKRLIQTRSIFAARNGEALGKAPRAFTLPIPTKETGI